MHALPVLEAALHSHLPNTTTGETDRGLAEQKLGGGGYICRARMYLLSNRRVYHNHFVSVGGGGGGGGRRKRQDKKGLHNTPPPPSKKKKKEKRKKRKRTSRYVFLYMYVCMYVCTYVCTWFYAPPVEGRRRHYVISYFIFYFIFFILFFFVFCFCFFSFLFFFSFPPCSSSSTSLPGHAAFPLAPADWPRKRKYSEFPRFFFFFFLFVCGLRANY